MNFLSVAWVPDDDEERDWSVAAGVATAWVDARCSEEGAMGVLVTNTLDYLGVPELNDFERRHTRASRLGKADRAGRGTGPVLAYVPQADDLHFAMGLARSSSLAVIEGRLFPLRGWAAWFEAINLVTEQTTPPFSPHTRKAIERLAFHGNNGYGDPFGKQQALSILTELRSMGDADDELVVSAVLAAGVRPRGVKNLQRLMEKL
ncbi:MAG: hypothetical protein M3198_11300 [Actinomycetota bacterium]|nr:hypothetical protein [Actinomycetota bacterium]